ncbi:MAG: hypothetical protein OXC91_04935 [Rhodobacteraceae bacterium]|nr:hypothetical protein [Paracoccaceae bacterium]
MTPSTTDPGTDATPPEGSLTATAYADLTEGFEPFYRQQVSPPPKTMTWQMTGMGLFWTAAGMLETEKGSGTPRRASISLFLGSP